MESMSELGRKYSLRPLNPVPSPEAFALFKQYGFDLDHQLSAEEAKHRHIGSLGDTPLDAFSRQGMKAHVKALEAAGATLRVNTGAGGLW